RTSGQTAALVGEQLFATVDCASDGRGPVVESRAELLQTGGGGHPRTAVVAKRALGGLLPIAVAAVNPAVDEAGIQPRPPQRTIVAERLQNGNRRRDQFSQPVRRDLASEHADRARLDLRAHCGSTVASGLCPVEDRERAVPLAMCPQREAELAEK